MRAKRSAWERFGGEAGWKLPGGVRLNIGDAIVAAGPGQGVALLPWGLTCYARAMRLRPGELWLLQELLRHAWTFGQEVFISMRRLELAAVVDRATLQRWAARLEDLRYIVRVGRGLGLDRRIRYDVRNTYAALAICIAYDESSKWAKAAGAALTREQALALTGFDGRPFDLDLDAIDKLNERRATLAARHRERAETVPA